MKKIAVFFLIFFFFPLFVFSRGDKVIPQVADGNNIRTKFDLVNISDFQKIENCKLRLYRQDGSPWVVQTNLGEGNEFPLTLSPRQTLRVETMGKSSPTTAGYAELRDEEPSNSIYSKDFAVGVTVYYEIYSSEAKAVDTVSVPVASPTALFAFPVEMNEGQNLFTGLAIVNLSGENNPVTLRLFRATVPSSQNTAFENEVTFNLNPFEQRAEFFHQKIFPGLLNFKGMVEGLANRPVAILALLQTGTPYGVQYATVSPTYKDSLRHNSYVLLPQTLLGKNLPMPLDVDAMTVDYFGVNDAEEDYPWDLKYEGESKTSRKLVPVNGAGLVALGKKGYKEFDEISLPQLRNFAYSFNPLDLSDTSPNLVADFAFAVRTDLGRYAKIRIIRIVDTTAEGVVYKDLGLEVYVYK